jgi:hypothetical protein
MTNLYQKSGPQSIVGGLGYSSVDNNVSSVSGVSYSMIGETTPTTFYEALTEEMMEDGFLSRFLVVEYDGMRVPSNSNIIMEPDTALRKHLNEIAYQADVLISKGQSQLVERTEEAATLMHNFEIECDEQINGTDDEARRQMWNRAALKALRLAAVLAVADNVYTPVITKEHYVWALKVVRKDIQIMRRRLDTGDVGSGDLSRERKMISVLKDYLTKELPGGYKIPAEMRLNSIVPRRYLQTRCSRAASFYNYKNGNVRALDETIASLILNGYLMEVKRDAVSEAYGDQGKCFRILRLPDYEAESKK